MTLPHKEGMVRSLTAKTRNAMANHRKWVQVPPNHLKGEEHESTESIGMVYYSRTRCYIRMVAVMKGDSL